MKCLIYIENPVEDNEHNITDSNNKKIGFYILNDKNISFSTYEKYGFESLIVVDVPDEIAAIPVMLGPVKLNVLQGTMWRDLDFSFSLDSVKKEWIINRININEFDNTCLGKILFKTMDKPFEYLDKHLFRLLEALDSYIETNKVDTYLKTMARNKFLELLKMLYDENMTKEEWSHVDEDEYIGIDFRINMRKAYIEAMVDNTDLY